MAQERVSIDLRLNPSLNENELRAQLERITRTSDDAVERAGRNFAGGFREGLGRLDLVVANLQARLIEESLRAIGDAARESVASLRNFSRGIAEINSILPQNTRLTRESERAIIDFSSQFATRPAEQARAFYNIVSSGVRGTTNQLRRLQTANLAATAGLVNINDAARVLAASVNTYERSGLTAERASDILFATVREGITTFDELSTTIGRVAPIANAAGVSFEEVGGALGFITRSGVSTDEAVTGLRALINGIISPSEGAANAARQLGINFSTAAIRAEGFAGFLGQVRQATGGSEVALARLFPNIRALNAAVQITGGNFETFERILGEVQNSAGATADAFETISQNLDFRLSQRAQEFRNFFLIVGRTAVQTFGNATAAAIPSIEQIIQGFISVGEAINRFVIAPAELIFNAFRVAFNGVNNLVGQFVAGIGQRLLPIADVLEQIGVENGLTRGLRTFAETSQEVANETSETFRSSVDRIFEGTAFGAGEEFLTNFRNNIQSASVILDEANLGSSIPPILGGAGDADGQGVQQLDAAGESIESFGVRITTLRQQANQFAVDFQRVAQQVRNAAIQGIGGGIGAGFAAFGAALVRGQDAIEAFGRAFLASIGQAAVALGTRFILEGVAISFNPLLGGAAIVTGKPAPIPPPIP